MIKLKYVEKCPLNGCWLVGKSWRAVSSFPLKISSLFPIIRQHNIQAAMVRRIALFGLSANPPTGECGHVGIVRALVKSGRFDEIWILPVYQHMYSSKRNLVAYDQRLQMCRVAFVPESSPSCVVKVLMTEREAFEAAADKPGVDAKTVRVGTIDVIKFIKSRYEPGKVPDLSLVLGSDTFKDIMSGKWKDSEG